jgi:hypothetical protein
MSPNLFSVAQIGNQAPIARGLSLPEACARVMALSGRERWAFTRTARVMHLVIFDPRPADPSFESEQAVDRAARNDIMVQVCAHGFGQFRVSQHDPALSERITHERAA